jgi:hypothetical protein
VKKLLLLFSLALGSCTTRVATEEKKNDTPIATYTDDKQALDAVLQCLSDASGRSCSLIAEGSITLKDGGSSQSGHFALKSKRLASSNEPMRVDSLSMIVTGPFGITGVKFLGAPEEYQFYNAIQGEKYRGKPDPKTLQDLTGMKGLTLESLSDVIYGLAPSVSQTAPGDSVYLKSVSAYRHILYIRRNSGITEAITLNGLLPKNENEKAKLTITEYERWNHAIAGDNPGKPDVAITYHGIYENKDFALPNYITAKSGSTELEIEYTSAEQNPKELTVKIKMPK